MHKFLFLASAIMFLMGLPLFLGWLDGQFVIFWTKPGAALFQAWGISAALLVGAVAYFRDTLRD